MSWGELSREGGGAGRGGEGRGERGRDGTGRGEAAPSYHRLYIAVRRKEGRMEGDSGNTFGLTFVLSQLQQEEST